MILERTILDMGTSSRTNLEGKEGSILAAADEILAAEENLFKGKILVAATAVVTGVGRHGEHKINEIN